MGCVYSMQKDNLSQPPLWKVILQRLRALSIREPHLVYHRSPSIKFACAYLLQSGSAHAYHEHVCWLVSYMFTTHYVESVQIRSYFWSKISCIRTEYGDLLTDLFLVHIFLIQSKYRKIRARNNSVFGPISCNDCICEGNLLPYYESSPK